MGTSQWLGQCLPKLLGPSLKSQERKIKALGLQVGKVMWRTSNCEISMNLGEKKSGGALGRCEMTDMRTDVRKETSWRGKSNSG